MNRAELAYAMDELVTTGDIAERLGVSRATPWNWSERFASFPQPLGMVGKATVYWWPEVKAWHQSPTANHRTARLSGDSRVG